jgi:hypothetical protein
MRTIAIAEIDRRELSRQFERMFIAADHETTGGMYSADLIKKAFPEVFELYRLACL